MTESWQLLERRRRALGPAYSLFYDAPLQLQRGEGVWLWDPSGKRYLDCYNNVASVGHCHPQVVEALASQAALLNTNTRYLHPHVVELAERLTVHLPGDLSVCMFVCTGTEANDLAARIARTVTGHQGMLVSEFSYHGNSTLVHTLSTADSDARPDWLATFPPPCRYRPTVTGEGQLAGYVECVKRGVEQLRRRGHAPAAIMIDTIFDCPGTVEAPAGYFPQVFAAVRAAGGLVIADEVQAGFCRTGKWWGFAHDEAVPDIVTLGKPMGAGHPLAAVVTTPAIAERFAATADYFNTFGGNPVSAAVGMAVLEVIEREKLEARVARVGAYTRAGLERLRDRFALIGDVRGRGLFLSVDLVAERESRTPDARSARRVVNLMKEAGVLISTHGPHGNVLKIRPPMVFDEVHADYLLSALESCLGKVS